MREAYRLQKNTLQKHLKDRNTGLNLFFIYTGKELPSYDIIYEKMALALQKLTDSIEQ
jgi:ribonuclease P protein component